MGIGSSHCVGGWSGDGLQSLCGRLEWGWPPVTVWEAGVGIGSSHCVGGWSGDRLQSLCGRLEWG